MYIQNRKQLMILCTLEIWWTVTEEGNGPNIKDRTRNGYNNGEINHTANNHNKNIIDSESKVSERVQESKLVEKEALNLNIQTSHIGQYKYPYNTKVSNEHITERVPHQKGSGEELNQSKGARVTGIGKRNAGKNLRVTEKEEINKAVCPCYNKYVETDVECG